MLEESFLSNKYQRGTHIMNILRWLTSLFIFGRSNRWIFGKRRNKRGMMLSLLGLGVGAVATYGMTRRRGNNMAQAAVQPILSRVNFKQLKNILPNQ
jgi:hypothetical protein